MTEIKDYARAATLTEALDAVQNSPAQTRLLAGGTDLLLKLRAGIGDPVSLIDISDISDLIGIHRENGGIRIRAATKLRDIECSPILYGSALDVLAFSASQVGSPQIRNLASLGGNICNAAPSADTAAPLLVLDSVAHITSHSGQRSIPLTEFFLGPGKTILKPGEILTSLNIPTPLPTAHAVYIKLCPRRAMDLAVISIAVLLSKTDGRFEARIAIGAVAPTPLRVFAAEEIIKNADGLEVKTIQEAARITSETAKPISDVRGSMEYRREMVQSLTERALFQLAKYFE